MQINKEVAPSRATAAKVIYAAFTILKEEGGKMAGREVIEKIRSKITFSDWELEVYEKTGYIRWESMLHFFSVDCTKAGYLRKAKGIWYLTPEGEEAMKLGAQEMLNSATMAYRRWAVENKSKEETVHVQPAELENTIEALQSVNIEQLQEQAISGIKEHLTKKNPYEFQDLVAALLRAMGYHTPFVSPKGKDGGIDIIAYQDPLGIQKPRIKVQVKHYPQNPIAAEAIRSLKGLINNTEEVGLFVTSGRFSSEAERFAREANVHIKLIDGDELIDLWQQFYEQMNDEDKSLLPLHPVYFLAAIS
jgi:restriction system protein